MLFDDARLDESSSMQVLEGSGPRKSESDHRRGPGDASSMPPPGEGGGGLLDRGMRRVERELRRLRDSTYIARLRSSSSAQTGGQELNIMEVSLVRVRVSSSSSSMPQKSSEGVGFSSSGLQPHATPETKDGEEPLSLWSKFAYELTCAPVHANILLQVECRVDAPGIFGALTGLQSTVLQLFAHGGAAGFGVFP